MQFIYSLMICGLVCMTSCSASICPPPENIYPCNCDDFWDLTISCRNLTTVEQLKTVVQGTKGFGKFNLILRECKISDVPNDIFNGTNIILLEFEDSEITVAGAPGDPNLVGLENSLRNLKIVASHKEKFGPMTAPVLGHLKKLRYLVLERNYVTELGNDWFQNGPTGLKEVTFMNNEIRKIGDKAFATLENLEYCWITLNKDISFQRSMFPTPATKLGVLSLEDNGLSSLPDDMFSEMPALHSVYLHDNKFPTISEAVWSTVWRQLDNIDLYDNPIVCDEKIKWLYQRRGIHKVYAECAEPENLKGKSLQMLSVNDFP